jgi:hypothetical protein
MLNNIADNIIFVKLRMKISGSPGAFEAVVFYYRDLSKITARHKADTGRN